MTADATTWLFVAGTTPQRFTKATQAGADAVVLDLEDAVLPDLKSQARDDVQRWLSDGGRAWVRINSVDSSWHDADLAAVSTTPGLAGIVLPKADAEAVAAVRDRLATSVPLIALVETARGIHQASELAEAGVSRLMFGSLDFSLDVNCDHTREALLYARSALVIASRFGGLPGPVDGVTPEVKDVERVSDDAVYGRSLGFTGKLCIHPVQVEPAASAFRPTADELAWAQGVVDAAAGSSGAVTGPDGQMIDQPVLDRARAVLASA